MFDISEIDEDLDIKSPIKVSKKIDKIPISIDLTELDLICAYVLNTETAYITYATLSNIKNLFDLIDMRFYETHEPKMARVHFIKEALKLRIDEKIGHRKVVQSMILNRVPGKYRHIIDNDIMPDAKNMMLSKEEIRAINTSIVDLLINGYVLRYKNDILRIIEKIESGNYDYLKNVNNEFEVVLNNLQNEIRNSKAYIHENTVLTLDNMENVVTAAAERLKSSKNKLNVGIQYWNRMLSNGYEASRVYIYAALTGIGKSNILLNSLVQIRNNNMFIKTKDPTKKPTILFITQENNLDETIERLFNITVCTDDIRDFTKTEIVHKLKTEGGFKIEDGKMNINVRYYGNREISTGDIYGIIEDIEKTGYEVVSLIHDYIYRIRSMENHNEFRLELGAVTNEFGNIAKFYGIPVITATQLTRKASEILQEAISQGKLDVTQMIADNHVAEAWLMVNNTDALIAVHKEFDLEGQSYYVFKRLKMRGRPLPNDIPYFAHPIENNGINLKEDMNGEILSKDSIMATTNDMSNAINNKTNAIKMPVVDNKPFNLDNLINSDDVSIGFKFKFNVDYYKRKMERVKK